MLPAVSQLSADVQGRLRALVDRYRAPARRPRFFLVLYALLGAMVGGALLARAGTPLARGLAAAIMVGPLFVLLGIALWHRRRQDDLLERAVRATVSVDAELGARMQRAARLLETLASKPTGESVQLSAAHLEQLVLDVPAAEIELSARKRGRVLGWAALVLALGLVLSTWGRVLPIVEGMYVLVAQRGVAPLRISYVQESELIADLPAYVAGTARQVPVLYEDVLLPSGTEITWRMVPRAAERKYVVTDGLRDVPFVSDGRGSWVARLRVDDSSELRVAAVFGEVKIENDERLRVSTVPDRPPTVTLLGGPREVRIAELDRVPIEFVAQDDYGLSLVELVIESGERKERQELARLDGTRRSYRAGAAITRKTPLVQGAYQPVIVTVQARDGDLITGPHWGKSEAIVLLPEPIGDSLAQRHLALRAFRGAILDYRMAAERSSMLAAAERKQAGAAAHDALARALVEMETALEKSPEPPRGSLRFLKAQVSNLASGEFSVKRAEAALLGADVLMTELSRADAQRLSRELGDVVAEVAARVRGALGREQVPSTEQLLASLEATRQGAERLSEVGTLGLDLGSVAQADLARARRLLEATELSRAEAVLLHLAARLERATPSFGSKSGSVESGAGSGRGGQGEPSLSKAPSEYDRLGEEARSLAERHASEQRELEALLDEAARAAQADARANGSLDRLTEELREALGELPRFGRVPGSTLGEAAQARNQGEAMADALDAGQLERALESGRAATEALARAKRANEEQGGYLHDGDLEAARAALERAREAAENARRSAPKPDLGERAERQRELGRAAAELAERSGQGSAPLPAEVRDALRRAGELMKKAADALDRSEGERGRQLSAEAQEELERALPERRQEDSGTSDGDSDAGESRARPDGHADVPGQGEDRSRDFRRRVEAGLGREAGRFGPAVRRYAETLK